MEDFEVSIIIPNYCHSQYLDERINSILNQTFQKYEIIILDDCSPDNGASKRVIEKYRGNPHVSQIIYNKYNSGSPFRQWERGIEMAQSDIIWIAESDDACAPTLLEELLTVLIDNDAVMAFCRSTIMDRNSHLQDGYPNQRFLQQSFCMAGKSFIKNYMVFQNIVVNASAVLFRKSIAQTVDHQYMEFRGLGDWLFWIEVAEKGKVCFVDKSLNYFRKYGESTTDKVAAEGINSSEFKKIYDYLSLSGYVKKFTLLKSRYKSIHSLKTRYVGLSDEKRKGYLELWGYKGWGIIAYHIFDFLVQIKQRITGSI